jgi:hypothetical protein
MKVGTFYRLKNTIRREHQDCLFTYPQGLVLKLREIREEPDVQWHMGENEDGPFEYLVKVGVVKVHLFDTFPEGMSEAFDPKDVELLPTVRIDR